MSRIRNVVGAAVLALLSATACATSPSEDAEDPSLDATEATENDEAPAGQASQAIACSGSYGTTIGGYPTGCDCGFASPPCPATQSTPGSYQCVSTGTTCYTFASRRGILDAYRLFHPTTGWQTKRTGCRYGLCR